MSLLCEKQRPLLLKPFLLFCLIPIGGMAQMDTGHRKSITALGRLEPVTEVVAISSGQPGERLARLLVKQGQKVQTDEILAYLGGHAVRLATKQTAEARLRAGKAIRAADKKLGRSLIEEIRLQLRKLRELMPLKIEAQEARIKGIRSQLAIASYELERLRGKSSSREELIAARVAQELRTKELETQLVVATKELSQLRSTRTLEQAEVERKLATATARLERNLSVSQLGTLEAEVKKADAELQRSVLRAPMDGTVLRILTQPGERVGRSAILEMADTDRMYVVAEVYETDVRFVRTGQRAEISSPALPEALTGVVDSVGLLIAKNDVLDIDPAARVDARVVEVRIRLDSSEVARRFSNLQVRVRIDVQTKDAG